MNINKKFIAMYSFLSTRFAGRAGVILLGSVLGQGITLLVLPFTTQVYNPSVLGQTASILSIVSISALFVCFQYDQAIIVAHDDEVPVLAALSMLGILLWTVLVVFILTIDVLLIDPKQSWLVAWDINWTLPGLLLTYGLFTLFTNINLRENKLKRVSIGRAMYYGGGAIFQVMGGFLISGSANTYLWAQILASMIAIMILFTKEVALIFHTSKIEGLISTAQKYSNFPKYLMGGGVLNAASIHMPQIFLRIAFGDEWAGWYFIAQRFVAAPTTLLSQAVGQVFYRDSSEKERNGLNQSKFLEQVVAGLIKISFLPGIIIGIFSPTIITLIFGDEWSPVSQIFQILIVGSLITFVVSPISFFLNVKGLQREDFLFKGTMFIFRFIGLLIGWWFGSAFASISFYTIASIVIMCFYLYYIINTVSGSLKNIFKKVSHIVLLSIFLILLAAILTWIGIAKQAPGIIILLLSTALILFISYF